MQSIDPLFKSNGFTFKLIQREGKLAIFGKTKPNHSRVTWEVVKLQTHKAHTWPSGETSPEREAMPSPESWGTLGWSYLTLQDARRRFASLATMA